MIINNHQPDYGSATTTTWVDNDGTMWVDGATNQMPEIQSMGRAFRELRDRQPIYHLEDRPSITYDPEKKKFVVCRGWDYQDKEFNTKRSARRFIKRWLDKQNGVAPPKKDITKIYKEKARQARAMEEMARARAEIERLMMEQEKIAEQVKLKVELQELDDNYYERLGL